MMISIIACIGKDNELGFNNKLVFHIPEDMKFFRNTTRGHSVLMGYKTCLSIGRALPNRVNYVLTHHPDDLPEGFIAVSNLDEFLVSHKNEEIFIIGGAIVYELLLPYATNLYLTEVDANHEADAFFPIFDKNLYNKTISFEGEHDGIKYAFAKYTKK